MKLFVARSLIAIGCGVLLLASPGSAEVLLRVGFSPTTGYAGVELKHERLALSLGYFGTVSAGSLAADRASGYIVEKSTSNLTAGGTYYFHPSADSLFLNYSWNVYSSYAYSFDNRTNREDFQWLMSHYALLGYRARLGSSGFDLRIAGGVVVEEAPKFEMESLNGSRTGFAWEIAIGFAVLGRKQ